jgi:tetratricopeptide (TPR) repeat protein
LSQRYGDRRDIARALLALGQLDVDAGNHGGARRRLDESVALYRVLGDKRGVAEAIRLLSTSCSGEGEVEKGVQLARECVSIYRDLGDPAGVAWTLRRLAITVIWAGEYAQSQAHAEECLEIDEDLGIHDPANLIMLAYTSWHQGRYAQARSYLEAGLALAREKDDLHCVSHALCHLGAVAVAEGRYQEATELIEECIPLFQTFGRSYSVGEARCVLGYAARGQGDLEQAQQLLAQELRLSKGDFLRLVYALPGAALIMLDRGKPERAVETYESVRRFRTVADSRWFEDVAGKHIAAAAATLPPDMVAAAQERGRTQDPWAVAQELSIELSP